LPAKTALALVSRVTAAIRVFAFILVLQSGKWFG
jgi:hypothetical protein